MPSAKAPSILQTQTAALVHELGGNVELKIDYPVPKPGISKVLAKVRYTDVCQSDLHTKTGTAASATGDPITKIKLRVGGYKEVGQIIMLGPKVKDPIKTDLLVGIRFLSRVCHECDYLAGHEQYCANQQTICITKTVAFSSIACWMRGTLQYCLMIWILVSKGPCFV
jgi:propanol-preferring alcohol dehydrogenase